MTAYDWLSSIIMLTAIAVVVLNEFYQQRIGVSPMPTLPAARKRMLDAVPQAVTGPIYELGCGWGTLALPLARRFPACAIVAVERSLVPWMVCLLRVKIAGLRNIRLVRDDFFTMPLDQPAVILCYLWPAGMIRLYDKLCREAAPGTLIISHNFIFPALQPEQMIALGGATRSVIYVYRLPPNHERSA